MDVPKQHGHPVGQICREQDGRKKRRKESGCGSFASTDVLAREEVGEPISGSL